MTEQRIQERDLSIALRSLHFIPVPLLAGLLEQEEEDGGQLAAIGADMLVFDLEDSVRPQDRESGREWLSQIIQDGRIPQDVDFCVRINMPGSEWWKGDLEAFDGEAPLIIPKISTGKDIPSSATSTVIPILETLSSLDLMPELALIDATAGKPDIPAVIFGKEDLMAELGYINTDPNSTNPVPSTDLRINPVMRAMFSYIRWGTSHTMDVLDGVTRRLDWGEESISDLEAECAYVRRIGASGKVTVHLSQVATANHVFCPQATIEVERQSANKPDLRQDLSSVPNLEAKLKNAKRIVRVFEENSRRQNIAALEIDGVRLMIGPPAYRLARAILDEAAGWT